MITIKIMRQFDDVLGEQELHPVPVAGKRFGPVTPTTARSNSAWAFTSFGGIATGSCKSASVEPGNSFRTSRTFCAVASTAVFCFFVTACGQGSCCRRCPWSNVPFITCLEPSPSLANVICSDVNPYGLHLSERRKSGSERNAR